MSAKDLKFTFTQDGEEYTIPRFTDLPTGVIRKARKAEDDLDRVFTILENVLGLDCPELDAIDRMTTSEFAEFLKEWTGGVAVGESSGS
jgi:hypothetical protein